MKIMIAVFAPLAMAACSPLEPLPVGVENFTSANSPTHLHDGPTVEYLGYRVVEPADWRGVNDSQKEN